MAALLALGLLATASLSTASLLPPRGCLKSVCDSYRAFPMPQDGDAWSSAGKKMLAFYKGAFNDLVASSAPKKLSPEEWAALGTEGYGSVQSGPPSLPSLNFQYYLFEPSEIKKAKAVDGHPNPDRSLADCCHSCRLSSGCSMFYYVPPTQNPEATSTDSGKCYFLKSGPNKGAGPYDWKGEVAANDRTQKLGDPDALSPKDSKKEDKKPGTFPGYSLAFLGGYCNSHKAPSGEVTDDPHFTGARGTRFDFNGELNKAFCLVTDKSFHLNALLDGYTSDNIAGAKVGADGKAIRSWIREVGLMWKDAAGQAHSLHLVARKGKEMARGTGFLQSASLDDTAIAVPSEAGASVKAPGATFTYLGATKKGWFDVDNFQVVIDGQVDLSISMRAAHPKLQIPEDAEVHFNLMFNDIKVTDAVHGVLGQTYRTTPGQVMRAVKYSQLNRILGQPIRADQGLGAGFLDGSIADYESSHVLKTDCKVSSYE